MTDSDKPQIYKNRYKVDKKLGAGNAGTTYRVFDLSAKHELKVLKVVRLCEMDSEQANDSVREAELLSVLDNEYIVKFYEAFLENDCLCLVTELCEGGDLYQRLKELKKQSRILEEDQVIEWLIQILIAVQYMHKCRILHGDLKAKNIFLKSNQVKIGNFGFRSLLLNTMDLSTTFIGVPCSMSPEVMKHDGYESKSDIWSVGCLLYEMCTYRHAFDGKGLVNVMSKVVEGESPWLPKTYSKELNDLLKKMFIKDPKHRPSAVQLLGTPFIIQHRERTKLTGPLENTVNGNLRSNQINARLQNPINSHNWSISSTDHIADDEQPDNIPNDPHIEEEEEEEEEEEQTLKPGTTLDSARQAMVARKMQEADARGQLFKQPISSNEISSMNVAPATLAPQRHLLPRPGSSHNCNQNLLSTHLPPASTSSHTPTPSSSLTLPPTPSPVREATVVAEQVSLGSNTRVTNEITVNQNRVKVSNNPLIIAAKTNQLSSRVLNTARLSTLSESPPDTNDTRPIMPMRRINRRMSDTFDDEGGDSQKRSTKSALNRTIDPRCRMNSNQPLKSLSSTKANDSKAKQNASIDDSNAILKVDPKYDEFGPIARERKTDALRIKAIQLLGEATYEKVYDYLVRQRTAQKTDPKINEDKINQGLAAFPGKPSDYFLVDQLVFLDMMSL